MDLSTRLLPAIALLFAPFLYAQEPADLVPVFGPQTVTVASGAPTAAQFQFGLQPLIHGPYYLAIQNRHVGVRHVELNGRPVFPREEARQALESRSIPLAENNVLNVTLQGVAGESLIVAVIGHRYSLANDYADLPLTSTGAAGKTTGDWRPRGVVTPVKDQASGPSSAPFSATGALEAAWALARGPLVSLSEQQLLDCATFLQGYSPAALLRYAIRAGVASTASYAYTGRLGACRLGAVVARPSAVLRVPIGDEESLSARLRDMGPVSVVLNGKWLSSYRGGIAQPNCEAIAPVFQSALIVGLGTEGDTPYWIVKNSVGRAWGENGYFRIVRGRNECGIADYAIIPVI